jgi:hypothetical protein
MRLSPRKPRSPKWTDNVGTTCPINVNVNDEVRHRGTVKKQVVVKGVLEVAKDALHSHEMGLVEVVDVEAHLLDYIGEVAVSSRVTHRGIHVRGNLGMSVDRRGAGLVVTHASVSISRTYRLW